jgi:hypothetical protein
MSLSIAPRMGGGGLLLPLQKWQRSGEVSPSAV